MKRLFVLFILLPLIFLIPPASAQYQVGEHVDNFMLPDYNNQSVNLYDYLDRIVILQFWENG